MAQTPEPRTGDRIAKLLARAGVASRREVERMIEDGRVALDGKVLDTPATVLRSLQGVTVDGQPVALPEPTRLFLYHKPTGLLVTERDPKGRPTIYDRLPTDLPRLVPVGRLDLNTEGLLLLTTDGGFKRQLELPSTGVERSYRARAYGNVTQAQLEDLAEGVEIEGVRYGSIDANIERRTGANVWIEVTITEGKNREVRRVLEYLGLQVSRLIRTRYGPFILGDLPVGGVGEVKQHEIVTFRRTLKGGAPDEPDIPAPRDGFRVAATVDRTARARTRAEQAPTARVARPRPLETPKPRREPERPSESARPGFRSTPTVDRAARSRNRADDVPKAREAQERPARTHTPAEGEGRRAPRRSDAAIGGVAARPARPGARPQRDGAPQRDDRSGERSGRPAPSGGRPGGPGGRPPRQDDASSAGGSRATRPGAKPTGRPPRRDGSPPAGGSRPTTPGGRPPRGRRP